ncbi:hypothetical protein WJX72_002550 [[Myrmecia] bisecta]|uniref:Protein kinase domain-containing protein n=1 Tax=[Myrmecia] bisecta TaxID=41462 RepID=A0AAW1PDM0_9CHLO
MALTSNSWQTSGGDGMPQRAQPITTAASPLATSSFVSISPFASVGLGEPLDTTETSLAARPRQSFKLVLANATSAGVQQAVDTQGAAALDMRRAASEKLPDSAAGARDAGTAPPKRVGSSMELARQPSSNSAAKTLKSAPEEKPKRRGSMERIRSNIEGALASFSSVTRRQEGPKKKDKMLDADGMYTGIEAFCTPMHVLHVGKAATFYIATAQQTGLKRVVKTYDKAKLSLADEKRVRNELALLLKIKHEGVLRCLGSWETSTNITIVQEYGIRGNLFSDLVGASEKLTERLVATKVLAPLLDTLAHLHSQQLIHRCIMPENLHWTGVGKDLILKLAHFEQAVDRRTVPCVRGQFGTLDYMAPEMLQEAERPADAEAQADSYDEKVDIWAVGVLAYELLTGKGPFEVESKELSCMLILYGEIEKFPAKMSPRAVDFIKSALIKDPVDRPSAAELRGHPWLLASLRAEALGIPEGQEHMLQLTQEHMGKPERNISECSGIALIDRAFLASLA